MVVIEAVAARVEVGSYASVVIVVYRPGSAAIQPSFFDELSSLFESAATFSMPVFVIGDFNVRLDRTEDPHTRQLLELVGCFGFHVCPTNLTHQLGGTIDAVFTRQDLPTPLVQTIDVGLSDHYLLEWSVDVSRSSNSAVATSARPWRHLDIEALRSSLRSSPICHPDEWPDDVNEAADFFDDTLTDMLDHLIPIRHFVRRPRPSDPWFDKECRDAKRLTRLTRRVHSAAVSAAATFGSIGVTSPTSTSSAETAWREQRRRYRDLLNQKRSSYWQSKIEAERTSPKRLWSSIDTLLGRGRLPSSSAISVDEFSRYFNEKVASVRRSTEGSPDPVYAEVPSGCSLLNQFAAVNHDDVITCIARLPDKQSSCDVLPSSVLKRVAAEVSPFLTYLFNRSFSTGVFPNRYKTAYITPIIKKPGAVPSDVCSYRPISNLPIASKLLERLVARQVVGHLKSNDLLPDRQSAYRSGFSTETAILRVLSDILEAVDEGDVAILALFDLSAAFDTVDHAILLRRLQRSYGVDGGVLHWFESYLSGRRQSVRRDSKASIFTPVFCGIPQGSVLGPILFIIYTPDLLRIIERHGLLPHLFADDTQVYGRCSPSHMDDLAARVSACTDEILSWMRSNRLQLNADKTELIWCATSRRLPLLPVVPIRVGSAIISPSSSVRDLGVHIDADLSMRTHVSRTTAGCFAALRQIRSVRRSLPTAAIQTLVVSLVLSRLDYGNASLAGIPANLLRRLQSVLNAAARTITGLPRSAHISTTLAGLHWLRAAERIKFKLATLMFRCLHGTAPRYLSSNFIRVADVPARRRLRSSSTNSLIVRQTRLVTVGDRAFPVAGANLWNSLPDDITSLDSLVTFRRQLKTYLFRISYPDFCC
jgi:hypothetical protein